MRFIVREDDERTGALLGLLCVVMAGLLAPAGIALQVVAPPLYNAWTRHKVVFEPTFFALSTCAVLAFAIGQPASMILRGNNALRPLLVWAIASSTAMVAGVVVLTPRFGIGGAIAAIGMSEWCLSQGSP